MASLTTGHPHCDAETVPKRPCALLWDESFLFSSDIHVADGGIVGWSDLEQRYGILLNPARLYGEPGVVEGCFGRGRVILSLVHFDTPGDRDGAVVLRNLWTYLSSNGSVCPETGTESAEGRTGPDLPPAALESVGEIQAAVGELIAAGARNFLWYWRNPLLLQWRRGVRGLEYSTLAVMIGEIARRLGKPAASGPEGRPALPESLDPSCLQENLEEIRGLLLPFCEKAKRLLIGERFYMMSAPLPLI